MSHHAHVDKRQKDALGVQPYDMPSQFMLIQPCTCPPTHVVQSALKSHASPGCPVQFVTFVGVEQAKSCPNRDSPEVRPTFQPTYVPGLCQTFALRLLL